VSMARELVSGTSVNDFRRRTRAPWEFIPLIITAVWATSPYIMLAVLGLKFDMDQQRQTRIPVALGSTAIVMAEVYFCLETLSRSRHIDPMFTLRVLPFVEWVAVVVILITSAALVELKKR